MSSKNPYIGESVAAHIKREREASSTFAAAFDSEYERLQIAREVKALRNAEQISQAELARRVGTQQPAIARLESGKVQPSLGLLWKIAGATGRTVRLSFAPVVSGRKQVRPRAVARRARRK